MGTAPWRQGRADDAMCPSEPVKPSEQRLQELVDRINTLPSLPDVVHQVLDLINDPESSVSQLVEVLLLDQAMTARILRLANSAYYGFVRKIDTVTQAVAVLGKNDIGDHVLSTAMYGFLGLQGPGLFDRRAFWDYAFACAQCTKILLRLSAQPAERVYIASLLHDIGQLIIDEYYPVEHDRILSMAQENSWPVERAEQQVLGFDHALVGGLMAQRWNFPPLLVSVMRNHHDESETLAPGSQERVVRSLIDLSDRIVRSEGIGQNYDFTPPEIPEEMWFPLGLNAAHQEKVVASLHLALEKLGAVLTR
jgi:HD-like signal output (HDOD) protein